MTERVTTMTKPITFNYQDYVKLKEEHELLSRKYELALLRITRLKAKITDYEIMVRIMKADMEAKQNEPRLSATKK